MIDTHAHLYYREPELDELINRAVTSGVTHIINVGIDIETSLKSLEFSKKHPIILPTIGIHPGNCEAFNNFDELEILAQKYPFRAIGEIGLDYFKMYTDKETQKKAFIKQCEIAERLNLPIIIHNRQAEEDMITILKAFPNIKKVFHCFGSKQSFIEAVDNTSSFFSFTGNCTYAKKGKTVSAIRTLPLNKIMIETDCPYLSPAAYKDKKNEPAFVIEVAKRIAEIKNISVDEVIKETSKTAMYFFNIKQ